MIGGAVLSYARGSEETLRRRVPPRGVGTHQGRCRQGRPRRSACHTGVYREKLDQAVQVRRRGGGHGKQRQQKVRLGDEGRRGARPRRGRNDQDGGHGQIRGRERHGVAALVPRVPGRSAEALRPRPKGRPKGARSKPKPKPTREQELAEQVAYLKAKVAYLEKLRALRANKSRDASEAPSSDCSQGRDTGSTIS